MGPIARGTVLLWITILSGLVACTAAPAAGPTASEASTAITVTSGAAAGWVVQFAGHYATHSWQVVGP